MLSFKDNGEGQEVGAQILQILRAYIIVASACLRLVSRLAHAVKCSEMMRGS